MQVQIPLKIIGIPGPPQGPIEFANISETSVTLQWMQPLDNGGSDVESYSIERREVGKNIWINVATKCHKLSCNLTGMTCTSHCVF